MLEFEKQTLFPIYFTIYILSSTFLDPTTICFVSYISHFSILQLICQRQKPFQALLIMLVVTSLGPWKLPIESDDRGTVLVVPRGHGFVSPRWAAPQPVSIQVLLLSAGTLAGHGAGRSIPVGQSSATATSRSQILPLLLLPPLPPAHHEGMEAAAATWGLRDTAFLLRQVTDAPDGPSAAWTGASGVRSSQGLDAGTAEDVSAGFHGSGALQGIHADVAEPGTWRCSPLPVLCHCCSWTRLFSVTARTWRLDFHLWHSEIP